MNRLRSTVSSIPSQQAIIANMRPYFQPIVVGQTHEIFGFEALLRIPGIATADHLFNRWEATGEVAMVDIVMAQRVRSAVIAQGQRPTVTINVSALTIALAADRYLVEIAALSKETTKLIVELTETFPGLDQEVLKYFSDQCKLLDVDIAIDDCTPDYAFCQPAILQRVLPTILKLDGGLVNDCFRSGDSLPITTILSRARSVGAHVVAEHIATRELRDWVVSLGVQLLQGFYFGAAAPAGEISSYSTRPPELCS